MCAYMHMYMYVCIYNIYINIYIYICVYNMYIYIYIYIYMYIMVFFFHHNYWSLYSVTYKLNSFVYLMYMYYY